MTDEERRPTLMAYRTIGAWPGSPSYRYELWYMPGGAHIWQVHIYADGKPVSRLLTRSEKRIWELYDRAVKMQMSRQDKAMTKRLVLERIARCQSGSRSWEVWQTPEHKDPYHLYVFEDGVRISTSEFRTENRAREIFERRIGQYQEGRI